MIGHITEKDDKLQYTSISGLLQWLEDLLELRRKEQYSKQSTLEGLAPNDCLSSHNEIYTQYKILHDISHELLFHTIIFMHAIMLEVCYRKKLPGPMHTLSPTKPL